MQRIHVGLPLLFLDTKLPWQMSKSMPASYSVAPSQGAKNALTTDPTKELSTFYVKQPSKYF